MDDLPRIPSLLRDGEDLVDALESFLNNGTAGIAKAEEALARAACAECEGDGKGDANPP